VSVLRRYFRVGSRDDRRDRAMTIPLLVSLGYDKTFITALVATSGGLGVIIPPSIPFILYGLSSGVSVGDMFIAGSSPGS
jgi:C4-dicarboxylate transporter DctM subunit